MLNTKSKSERADPRKTFVCWNPVSGWADAEDGKTPISVTRGVKVRGDHPLIQAMRESWHEAFIEDDGRPLDELLAGRSPERAGIAAIAQQVALEERIERMTRETRIGGRPRPTIPKGTPVERLRRCVTGIIASPAGPCLPGEIVMDDDPRVIAHPELFGPIA
jgi:hypothetical protein